MQTISYIADGVQECPVSCVLAGLYAANVVLHSAVFSGRNPIKRPSRQHPLLMLFRISVGIPLNIVFGAWLALWIVFWEFVRRPLWKPRPVCHTDDRDSASVAMCGGGFRTWYHLGIYWGLYDVFGVKGVNTMKFSGASIGALVATVAACGVHPADIWAHIPAIAEAYRAAFFGHITKVGQFCRYLLHTTLPQDAHLRVKGRLFISISSMFPLPHNHLQSDFTSREDLIDAVIAAQYIPTWTYPGLCIHRRMVCIDGGVTNNLPALCEESLRVGLDLDDVDSWNADLVPSQPLARINTFVPADEANLLRMLQCGKEDIKRWLDTPRGRAFAGKIG